MVEFSDIEKNLLARCGIPTDDAESVLETYMQAAVLLVVKRNLDQDAVLVGRALQAIQAGRPERPSAIFDELISPIVELGETVNLGYDSPSGEKVNRNGKVIGFGSFLRVAVSDGEKVAEIDIHRVSKHGDYEFKPMTFLRDLPDSPTVPEQVEQPKPVLTMKHTGPKKERKPAKKSTKKK
jgi:hypothetical protein